MNLLEFINSDKSLYNYDKLELGLINEFYNDLLTPIRNNVKNVLEIGIQNGNSIMCWRDFFTNAEIYGMDINSCKLLENKSRVTQIIRDAYTLDSVNYFTDKKFDIIIDDGPHTFESMEFFIQNYLGLLNNNGIAIIEDIVDTTWTKKLCDLIDPSLQVSVIHMVGKQLTEWHRNKWRAGLDVIVVKKPHN
jgi:hypothetical protein